MRWGPIHSPVYSARHSADKKNKKEQKEGVAACRISEDVERRACDLEKQERESFSDAKRRCIEQTGAGRAEKSDNERPHQTFNHESDMDGRGIKLKRVPDVERPERYAHRAQKQAKREKDPEGFLTTEPERCRGGG